MIRPIAMYLPQYHPIPENDQWWGRGFTEWTNVTKAKPLFKDHNQPKFPADLGYYDLRIPEVREKQAEIADRYGIEGFCYYHYWFGNGRRILHRPFDEVLFSGRPDFPFMLCWANETWKGTWFGASRNKILLQQTYPGIDDYKQHFNFLLTAFNDKRYIKVDGKPLFYVYKTLELPNIDEFVNTFRKCAKEAGLPGLYLLAGRCPLDWNPSDFGFDGVVGSEFSEMQYAYLGRSSVNNWLPKCIRKRFWFINTNVDTRRSPLIIPYEKAVPYFISEKEFEFDYFPCIIPNWDNTPRSGNQGMVLQNSTPEAWSKLVRKAIFKSKLNIPDRQFIFIKSWNEWGEGNYLEPDTDWGYSYLEVLKNELVENG